jgi:hypothetical protein
MMPRAQLAVASYRSAPYLARALRTQNERKPLITFALPQRPALLAAGFRLTYNFFKYSIMARR